MPLNVNAALLQLDPLKPLNPSGTKDMSMQLKQLKLMRERFEYEKQRNIQEDEWKRVAEAGEMARARLATEREQERQDAAIEAATLAHERAQQTQTLADRKAAYDALGKRVDTGDYEGMDIDATRLNELGGLAEDLGRDENGFPAWRIELDAEAARKRDAEQEAQTKPGAMELQSDIEAPGYGRGPQFDESTASSLKRLGAMGYDTLGLRGNMAGTGVGEGQELSTEDAFRQAQRAARGPDEPDNDEPERGEPEPEPYQPGSMSEVDRAEAVPGPPGLEDAGVSDYDYAGEADAAKNFAQPGRSTPMAPPPGLEPSIFQATGRPARRPDQRDIMGSVPKNVIDTGSMADQRKQRLGPVMASIEASMPKAYQAHTRAIDEAALATGLPADKALELSSKLRAPADAALTRQLDEDAKREAAEAKAIADAKLGPKDEQVLVKYGRDAAFTTYKANKVKASMGIMQNAAQVTRMLSNKDTADDDKAINFMMALAAQSGHQSDEDALRMSGGKISRWDKIKEWLHENIVGGYGDQVKASMKTFAADVREREKGNVFSWMQSTERAMNKALNPHTAAGYREALDSIPDAVQEEYETEFPDGPGDEEEESEGGTTTGTGGSYTPPVRGADDGPAVDYEGAIPKESRIAYVHNNPGNLMYDKDNPAGAEPGEDKEGGGKWARFPTVQAGFEALRGYITRHDNETIHDFISRYAPASDGNDTEKYISDAVRELKAEPDDTVYYIDPYDLMRFIVRHESGTNMPYAYDKRDAELAEFEKKNPAPAPSETDPTERAKQLLRKSQQEEPAPAGAERMQGIAWTEGDPPPYDHPEYDADEKPLPPLERPDPGYKPEDEPARVLPPGVAPPPPRRMYTPPLPIPQLLPPAEPWMEPPTLIEPGQDPLKQRKGRPWRPPTRA